MKKSGFIIGYSLFFSVLTFIAITTQFIVRSQTRPFSPVNFFSFFTIESNIIVAIILALSCFLTFKSGRFGHLGVLRGAATVYILTTGIVYIILLRGLEPALQTTIPWVNLVLHYITPLVMLSDWVFNPPTKRLTWASTAGWLLFPLVFCMYSLIRGVFVGWYPYPFLNPIERGYSMVLIYCLGIAATVGLLCVLVKLLGNFIAGRSESRGDLVKNNLDVK